MIEGHAYHLYIIKVRKRKELYDHLRSKNIYCQIHYIPVHRLPYYQRMGGKQKNLDNAEKYYKQCLSLPMYPKLSRREQSYVIETVTAFLN
mgnify:CR=1 FL=1